MENPDISSDKNQFLCSHCNGLVLVPLDLPPTTAPCPYCGGMITSPGAAADQAAAAPPAAPPPVPPPAAIGSLAHGAPPPPAAETPAQSPPRPPVSETPATPEPKPVPQPAPEPAAKVEASEPTSRSPQQPPGKQPQEKPQLPQKSGGFPFALISLLLLGGGALTYFVTKEMKKGTPAPPLTPAGGLTAMDANYIRIGWQKDANRLLKEFLAAKKSEDKLPFVLNAGMLAPRVKEFYGNDIIDDSDTPCGAFSVYELSEDDRKRGLFMMTYDQPPQFDMREFFRPLATMEVQYGIDEADLLLSTLARAGNFAMEPLRVHAFFKKTSEGLKLDWEIYAQTKYRTFRNFTELPEPGHSGIFRVFIVEDVPDSANASPEARTYRLSDPAHTDDAARVLVKVDSEIGRSLSQINWRGSKDSNPLTRTATVELSWSGKDGPPQLQLSRFICWEFLGLGGQENKATAPAK